MKSCSKVVFLILLLSFVHNDSVMGQAKVLSIDQDQDYIWSQEFTYVLGRENGVKDVQALTVFTNENWIPLNKVDPKILSRETWCKFSIHNPSGKALSLRFSYRFMADTLALLHILTVTN